MVFYGQHNNTTTTLTLNNSKNFSFSLCVSTHSNIDHKSYGVIRVWKTQKIKSKSHWGWQYVTYLQCVAYRQCFQFRRSIQWFNERSSEKTDEFKNEIEMRLVVTDILSIVACWSTSRSCDILSSPKQKYWFQINNKIFERNKRLPTTQEWRRHNSKNGKEHEMCPIGKSVRVR